MARGLKLTMTMEVWLVDLFFSKLENEEKRLKKRRRKIEHYQGGEVDVMKQKVEMDVNVGNLMTVTLEVC